MIVFINNEEISISIQHHSRRSVQCYRCFVWSVAPHEDSSILRMGDDEIVDEGSVWSWTDGIVVGQGSGSRIPRGIAAEVRLIVGNSWNEDEENLNRWSLLTWFLFLSQFNFRWNRRIRKKKWLSTSLTELNVFLLIQMRRLTMEMFIRWRRNVRLLFRKDSSIEDIQLQNPSAMLEMLTSKRDSWLATNIISSRRQTSAFAAVLSNNETIIDVNKTSSSFRWQTDRLNSNRETSLTSVTFRSQLFTLTMFDKRQLLYSFSRIGKLLRVDSNRARAKQSKRSTSIVSNARTILQATNKSLFKSPSRFPLPTITNWLDVIIIASIAVRLWWKNNQLQVSTDRKLVSESPFLSMHASTWWIRHLLDWTKRKWIEWRQFAFFKKEDKVRLIT